MSLLIRWLRYNAVGLLGVAVQLGALSVYARALGLPYLWATPLAVETALLHNFVWHERWTWRDRNRHSGQPALARLLRFQLGNGGVSLLGNLLFMRLLVGAFGLPLELANLLSISCCAVLNFAIAHNLVFPANPALEPTRGRMEASPRWTP